MSWESPEEERQRETLAELRRLNRALKRVTSVPLLVGKVDGIAARVETLMLLDRRNTLELAELRTRVAALEGRGTCHVPPAGD